MSPVARALRRESTPNSTNGEVTSINDLITYNLNIEQFAQDVISKSEGPELVRAFWEGISTSVSVLDPALVDPELSCLPHSISWSPCTPPVWTRCDSSSKTRKSQNEHTTRKASTTSVKWRENRWASHENETYFILKSIIIDNLYGVDIMEEAVEICKLRLFLKLVAQLETYEQIEPLPDIDFNVRCG